MSSLEIELNPLTTHPSEWHERVRRYHWRRSFECYAAECDGIADYHRKQALAIEAKYGKRKDNDVPF